jgi:hypothetical protein
MSNRKLSEKELEDLRICRLRLEEIYRQGWIDYPKLSDDDKVEMMKFLAKTAKDIARISGVDPKKLDPIPVSLNMHNKARLNKKKFFKKNNA